MRRSRLLFPLLLILLLVEVASFAAMFSVVVFENAEGAAADCASAIRHFDLATQSLVEEPQKPAEKQSLYDKPACRVPTEKAATGSDPSFPFPLKSDF